MNIKEEIISILEKTKKIGIENLIKFLTDSDYFSAPSSTKYHSNYEGGLAEHSFNVYQLLIEKNECSASKYIFKELHS